MKKIDKSTLDKLIRVARKYWKTGDVDLLDGVLYTGAQLSKQAINKDSACLSFTDFVHSIVKPYGLKEHASNADIYKAFAVFGYEVVDEFEQDGGGE